MPGPTGGIIRRIGLRTGSEASWRNLTIGLLGSALTHEIIARPITINSIKLRTTLNTVAIPFKRKAKIAKGKVSKIN